MSRVLVLFAHPAISRSRANRRFVEAARTVPNVTVHDLYATYPDLWIDVPREQKLVSDHDVLVFQHPFYWYSTPAILKEWQDHVLTFGWAYGKGGDALRGKRFQCAITTSGSNEAYSKDGMHGITIDELLAPIRQTARLCGMVWLPPFVTYAAHRHDDDALADATRRYVAHLGALTAEPTAQVGA